MMTVVYSNGFTSLGSPILAFHNTEEALIGGMKCFSAAVPQAIDFYILNTPNFVSLVSVSGLPMVAAKLSPSTLRVSFGSITPSSHKRAEEK